MSLCELWKVRKSNISYFHKFNFICFILNTKGYIKKTLTLSHKSVSCKNIMNSLDHT